MRYAGYLRELNVWFRTVYISLFAKPKMGLFLFYLDKLLSLVI